MCDYSLCGIPNRLAIEREELVVYRFSTGSMGLASPGDLPACKQASKCGPGKTLWQNLRSLLAQPREPRTTPAVCIPPGAHLIVRGIPTILQQRYQVSDEETVVFVQLSAEVNTHRDAVRFHNGTQVRLQDLCEGMYVQVLSLSGVTESSFTANRRFLSVDPPLCIRE
jgi:hypothetical protein